MSHRSHTTCPLTARTCRSLGLRAVGAAASFAAFGLLAAACSDSKTVAGADTVASSSTTAETTTTVAETTSTVAEVTTTVAETVPVTVVPVATDAPPPPAACADDTAPSGSAASVFTIVGDWNGDGNPDSATSWAESGGAQWFVRTEIAGGPASSVALGDLGVGYAQVVSGVDLDYSLGLDPGMNKEEFVAIAGSAASGVILNAFGVDDSGCVFRFDDGGGLPFDMPVTGTVSYRSGVMCDGGAGSQFMVLKQATSDDDGATFTTTDTQILRTGARSLGLGGSYEGSLLATDGALESYSTAVCFGIGWIGGGSDD